MSRQPGSLLCRHALRVSENTLLLGNLELYKKPWYKQSTCLCWLPNPILEVLRPLHESRLTINSLWVEFPLFGG